MKKNPNPFIRRLAGLALGVLLAGVSTTAVHAKTTTWTNTVSGNWSEATNWNNGVPVDGDDIEFNQPGGKVFTTNDLSGSASAAGIVLSSITYVAGAAEIHGNPVVMDTAGFLYHNTGTSAFQEIHISLILKSTIDIINSSSGGSMRFWEPMVAYTGAAVGINQTESGTRIDHNTPHLFTGPISIAGGADFNVGYIADAAVQITNDVVSLTSGNNFFTYVGTEWDAAQVGQMIWLPAADTTSLLPLPIGTTITAVDTNSNTITLSTNAVASSSSALGRCGFPSSLGLASKDPSNWTWGSGSRLRFGGVGSTDRGITSGTITIQVENGPPYLELSGDWVEVGTALLKKAKSGTLVISGTNSYSIGYEDGGIGGECYVNSPGSMPKVNFMQFDTLFGGDGTVNGDVRLGLRDKNRLAPGQADSVGTLTVVGTLDANASDNNPKFARPFFEIDIDATTNDVVAVTGDFIPAFPDTNYNDSTNVLIASPTALNGVYTFITAGNIITTSNSHNFAQSNVVWEPVWVTTPPPGKTHTVSYDTNSTPQRVLLTVAGTAIPTIDLVSSANPAFESSDVVFTATVQVSGVTAYNATGTVTFDAGGVPFYTNSVVGGLLSVTNSVLPIGTTTITATYSGGGEYAPSANSLGQVIQANIPTTPTNIVFSVSGGDLTLSWPADYTGWALECQTNNLDVGLSSNWVEVPGSTTTNLLVIPINSVDPAVFYRLMYTP